MKRSAIAMMIALTIALVGALGCSSNQTSEPSINEGARDAGHAVGTAVREVGQGAKKVGKTIGHAARDGGRALKDAVKGE